MTNLPTYTLLPDLPTPDHCDGGKAVEEEIARNLKEAIPRIWDVLEGCEDEDLESQQNPV